MAPSIQSLMKEGIDAHAARDHAKAASLFAQALRHNRNNESAWLWLSTTLTNPGEQRYCYEQALAVRPTNQAVQAKLAALSDVSAVVPPVLDDVLTDSPRPQTSNKIIIFVCVIVGCFLVFVLFLSAQRLVSSHTPDVSGSISSRQVLALPTFAPLLTVLPTELPTARSTVQPTAVPAIAPTVVPTVAPTQEPVVQATLTKDTTMYALPGETYKQKAQFKAGDMIRAEFQGDDWIAVSTNGNVGWMRRENLNLSDDQVRALERIPGVFVIVTGKIVQEGLAGSVVFKGTVHNFGAQPATRVSVEIETFDANSNRVDLVTGYTDAPQLDPGDTRRFQAITNMDFDTFTYVPKCAECS